MSQEFWAKVRKTDECWLWTGSHNNKGYGSYRIGGKTIGAHRVSWELQFGPIADGAVVMHLCDNPPCVRPSHLALGGQSANIADAFRKGRISRYNALKTHCPKGHPYDEANTYLYGRRRICRACARDRRVRAERRPQTQCKRGHEFSAENTWIEKNGARHCRLCRREVWNAWARRTGRVAAV